MSTNRDTKILEAILFASGSPVLEDDLKDKIINKKDFKQEMENLKEFYKDRGINLIKTGNKWSFRTAESIKDDLTIFKTQKKKTIESCYRNIIHYRLPTTYHQI